MISNNSEKAVRVYLAAHDLGSQIDLIAARTSCDPALLKPGPYLIERAASKLGISASACVVVGDSSADVESARPAGALNYRLRADIR